MAWITFIVFLFVFLSSLYSWKKNKDKEDLVIAMFGMVGVFMKVWNYAVNNIFSFSTQTIKWVNVVNHYFWIPFLIMLGIFVIRKLMVGNRDKHPKH